MRIQDGNYAAHLLSSEVRLSGNGKPMICFLWKLDKGGETVKSFTHLTLRDGSPNLKGISLVRRWAPDWDGEDLYWFGEHLSLAASYPVVLSIVNEQSYNDPNRVYTSVKWVNPKGWKPGVRDAARSGEGVLTPDRGEFARHAEVILPMMSDVWHAFRMLFPKASPTQLELKWFELIDSCRENGHDVDQFTEGEWQKAIDKMKAM